MSYEIGYLEINSLKIRSGRRNQILDLTKSFIVASVYESIFVPATVCDIMVLDEQDVMGQMKLNGDEIVTFSFSVPDSEQASFVFQLESIIDVMSTPTNEKIKTYTLKCVSQEVFFDHRNQFSEIFDRNDNSTCADIIKNVHKNHRSLGMLKKPIVVEQTKGIMPIRISAMFPMQAINMLRNRAISPDHSSSSYVYFETRDNEQQVYKFVTIEGMFAQKPIATFNQSYGGMIDYQDPNAQKNILAYKVDRQFSSLDMIIYAGPQISLSVDLTTQNFGNGLVNPVDTNFLTAGTDNSIIGGLLNTYFNNSDVPLTMTPTDYSSSKETYVPQGTPNYRTYMALLLQNSLRIRVPGDTIIKPGTMITCNIVTKHDTDGSPINDPLLSGNFLVTRVHHRIGEKNNERPRYTCIIECIKAKPNTV